jgi:hypothetical protein
LIEGWFLDHPITELHYGDLFSWTSWAFFGRDLSSLTPQELDDNKEIVTYFEDKACYHFPPGFNPNVATIDHFSSMQRLLLLTHCVMSVCGV